MSTITKPSPTAISSLFDEFNRTKSNTASAVSKLAGSATLEGMDSINELIAEAFTKVQQYTKNTSTKSVIGKAKSRTLAVIDPNNSWAGKWLNNSSTNLDNEKLKEKTINEVVDILVKQIEKKRDEVIEALDMAVVIKADMESSLTAYKDLKEKANLILENALDTSREYFDAEMLISNLTVTIEGIYADIQSQINPLIGSARIMATKLSSLIPTIENELKYKVGIKGFQQKIADLHGMVSEVLTLSVEAGDIIRKDVNETTYKAIDMLSETGFDTARLEKIHNEEANHQKRINEAMERTQAKVRQNFTELKVLSAKLERNRAEHSNNLLANYSSID